MQAFAGLCLILSCAAGLVLGSRLLLAWQRTRMIAELSIGTTALTLSLSGVLLLVVSGVPLEEQGPGLRALTSVGLLLLAISSIALGVGFQRVFRPSDPWAFWLCAAGTASLLAWWGLAAWDGASGLRGEASPRTVLYYTGRLLIHGWGALECFNYHRRMRRRVAVGLAEPLVAHQFWLWGLSGAGLVASVLVGVYASYVLQVNVLTWPFGLFALSALGLVSSVSMWWAFFPPAFYQRLLLRGRP